MKSWIELEPSGEALDLREMGPTHECVCGSNLFDVTCTFEDGEISMYLLEATCKLCGSLVVVPTPVDED